MKRKFILRFKFFLSVLFLSPIIFTSCNNLTDAASLEPTDKNEVILESATAATSASTDENYVTLSGSLSTGGAYPEEIARTLSGEKVTEDSSSRSAFPAVSTTDSSLTYSITAKCGDKIFPGTISTDKKSYTVSIPVQAEAMTCTVEASILKGTDILFTGESESFTISSENQVVEVPAITLKAPSSGKGSIGLEIDVAESGISYCIVKLGDNLISDDDGGPFTVSSNKITVTKSDVDADAYSADFSFYSSNDELLYKFNDKGINVISGMKTNTWVQNGSEPWFVTTTDANGKKTTVCRITSAMVDSFKLTQIYVDPSRSTTEGESNYTRESGTFINPCTSFSKAIEKLTDATKDYTIYITGTLSGPQTIPSDIRAKTLTLTGTTGSTTDIFDGNQRGSALTISSSVPVIIRNLMITNGGPSVNGGGINMASGTYVELSDGVIVSGNSVTGKNGGGVYNNGGNLYLNGNAVIGKKGNEIATSSDFGNKVSGSGAGAGIYNGNNGKVLLGYKYDGSAAGKYVAATLEGGVYRNYLANTTPSSAYGGGIYNEKGTVMMSGERAYVAYNYAINGAGIALGGSASSASLVMNGGVIEGNQSNSGGDGAGVYCTKGSSITMESGSVIRNNKNARNGGGVYLNYDNCSLTMNGGTIEGNEVKSDGNGGAVYMHGMSSDSKSSFKVSGDAYIPCPDGKEKNDVYILDITSITVAGNLSRDYVASISGNSTYVIKTGYAILTNASGQSYVSSNYTKFCVISNDTTNWAVDREGKLNIKLIGTKAGPDTVGDIVFNDGSAMPYADFVALATDDERNALKPYAIALIFYKGTELNSDADSGAPDTTTVRTLGIGLKYKRVGLAWCTTSAQAYNNEITTIKCPLSGEAGALTFTGDKNGSDNLEQIAAFLDASNDTGVGLNSTKTEEEAAELYPAFYFAKNYKNEIIGSEDTSRIPAGSEFETGWYLPSIAELFQIYAKGMGADKVIDLNAAILALGGDGLETCWYLTSNQFTENQIYQLALSDGSWNYQVQEMNNFSAACCIRAF